MSVLCACAHERESVCVSLSVRVPVVCIWGHVRPPRGLPCSLKSSAGCPRGPQVAGQGTSTSEAS